MKIRKDPLPKNDSFYAWSNDRGLLLWEQQQAYGSGQALTHHVNYAHKGQFDQSCPACVELERKQNKTHEAK